MIYRILFFAFICIHLTKAEIDIGDKKGKPDSVYQTFKKAIDDFKKENINASSKENTDFFFELLDKHEDDLERRQKMLYNYTDNKFKEDLMQHLRMEGLVQIKSFGKLLRKNIKTSIDERNFTKYMVKQATKDFSHNMFTYFEYLQLEKPKGRPANELLLSDISEICNKLLVTQKRRMLHEFIDNTRKFIEKSNFDVIGKKLMSDKINNKKRDLVWICTKVKVCKSYPGFTGYLSQLLSFAIKWEDNNKYKSFVLTAMEALKNYTTFIDEIADEKSSELIFDMMNPNGNVNNSKQFLATVKTAIDTKNKYVYQKHPIMRAVALSTKMLIEMLDKVYFTVEEEIVRIEFESTMGSLKSWLSGDRHDLNRILYYYFGNMMRLCRGAWRGDIKKEVKTLIEIILYGEPKDAGLANQLFLNGSNFINKMNTHII